MKCRDNERFKGSVVKLQWQKCAHKVNSQKSPSATLYPLPRGAERVIFLQEMFAPSSRKMIMQRTKFGSSSGQSV